MGYGPGWGMMNGWSYYGPGSLHMVFWIVIMVAIAAICAWGMRSMCMPGGQRATSPRSSGLDVLEQRYARGEINRDEYLQKKNDIAG